MASNAENVSIWQRHHEVTAFPQMQVYRLFVLHSGEYFLVAGKTVLVIRKRNDNVSILPRNLIDKANYCDISIPYFLVTFVSCTFVLPFFVDVVFDFFYCGWVSNVLPTAMYHNCYMCIMIALCIRNAMYVCHAVCRLNKILLSILVFEIIHRHIFLNLWR